MTFIMQVSTRHADMLEIVLRSVGQPLSGVLVFLGRNLCAEDPICDSLGNWQQLVAMTYARDTENIVLRGPVDKLKEVRRCQFIIYTIPITFADFLPSSRSNFYTS